MADAAIDAVIFDWGGTLTRWHDVDFHAESLALAQAVVSADHDVTVCGSPAMIRSTVSQMLVAGTPLDRITYDPFTLD